MAEKVFPSVTGRDWFVVGKSLAYAVAVIDSLPRERRDDGLRADMVEIFNSLFLDGPMRAEIIGAVEAKTGLKCRLGSDQGQMGTA